MQGPTEPLCHHRGGAAALASSVRLNLRFAQILSAVGSWAFCLTGALLEAACMSSKRDDCSFHSLLEIFGHKKSQVTDIVRYERNHFDGNIPWVASSHARRRSKQDRTGKYFACLRCRVTVCLISCRLEKNREHQGLVSGHRMKCIPESVQRSKQSLPQKARGLTQSCSFYAYQSLN